MFFLKYCTLNWIGTDEIQRQRKSMKWNWTRQLKFYKTNNEIFNFGNSTQSLIDHSNGVTLKM